MTIHYHGTPITPRVKLYEAAGRCFCVSFAAPQDVAICHRIGQSVMLDNGAFSVWRSGKCIDWRAYYRWADEWLDCPTTWAVIPDVIEGDEAAQDALVVEWPFGVKGAPVWHMHESVKRLVRLTEEWPRVCIGSSSQYSVVMGDAWRKKMDEAWNALMCKHARTPNVHMLRGMATSGNRWPFASVDSTDVARNHHLPHKSVRSMMDRWDPSQCAVRWERQPEQMEML